MNLFTKILLAGSCLTAATTQAQVVTISGGTLTTLASPITHVYPNGVYEVIYRKTQLNQAGNITRLAFEKVSGTTLTPLDHVRIYLKHTTATVFTDGPIDSTGYVRVFKGSFTNATATGYQETVLDQSFSYDNVRNLSMLVIRQGGTNVVPADPGRATWLNSTMTQPGVCRRHTSGLAITAATQLLIAQNLVNTRFTFGAPTATRADEQVIVGGYPNPASTHFTVQLAHPGQAATVRISDVLGQTLRTEAPLATRNGQAQLDVADLPAGLYLLHVTQNQQHAVQRFVKE